MSDSTLTAASPAPAFTMSRDQARTFVGLMLGMFVAAISQTIVGTAMPRIVAELGGMEHYSWVATAAMLASAIITPIVGKLSDLYGRRSFYLAGLIVFMVGAVISGLAVNFGMLVVGRAVQGLGMGTLMPLSQTIIGDIVPPRQRGKYQGYMGAIFGVTTVAGPLAGGIITDAWGWRWLFFVALPVGLVALFVIVRFMKLPFERREATIDYAGMATLSLALVSVLLAASWGGTTYAWDSPLIIGLFVAGAVLSVAFVLIERRAAEPVLPLRLFSNSIFTLCLIAGLLLATLMFGAIIYLPVFAQGVLGVGATASGLIVMPLTLGQIVMGIIAGLIISRTGRYKELMLLGVVVLAVGVFLLTQLSYRSQAVDVTIAMIVFGVGLGAVMQNYTLLVQNAVARGDLGVATASTQFFRNVGSTLGISVWGTVMTSGLGAAILSHLPAGVDPAKAGHLNAGAVLDPSALASLPPALATAVRQGLADQLHSMFVLWLPIVGLLFLATLFIKEVPLRETVHTADESRREYLDTMASSSTAGVGVDSLSEGRASRTQERLLGLQYEILARQAKRPELTRLRQAVTDAGGGDFDRGYRMLVHSADLLSSDDPDVARRAEKYAVELADRTRQKGGLLSADLRADMAEAVTPEPREASDDGDGSSATSEAPRRSVAVDMQRLSRAGSDLTAALLVDLTSPRHALVED
ncbi:MDR family MFS transporter [Nigerium massiliense]|uniref:MDR family MFS transporter n=1 Tax=Nigerium massiliense TaxID=1522317 RepID=UPI00058CB1A5|nr:MDR family MFS transporter [Nigerium massiliense]